jgi:RimJ/RimL family protein N-acetyltransferase
MTDDLVLRQAQADDAEAFVRAYESAWDASAGAIVGRTLSELAPFDTRLEQFRAGIQEASDDAQAWVAERFGEIVGVAVGRREGDTVELRALYVVPEMWGSGVASRLMAAALAAVRGDAQDAVLWVVEENTRARRFYEREGWHPDGESRVTQFGPTELRYRQSLHR